MIQCEACLVINLFQPFWEVMALVKLQIFSCNLVPVEREVDLSERYIPRYLILFL